MFLGILQKVCKLFLVFCDGCDIAWHAIAAPFSYSIFAKISHLIWTKLLASLVMSFKPFGSVKVEWPGKADGRHLHHPPKGEVLLSLIISILNLQIHL